VSVTSDMAWNEGVMTDYCATPVYWPVLQGRFGVQRQQEDQSLLRAMRCAARVTARALKLMKARASAIWATHQSHRKDHNLRTHNHSVPHRQHRLARLDARLLPAHLLRCVTMPAVPSVMQRAARAMGRALKPMEARASAIWATPTRIDQSAHPQSQILLSSTAFDTPRSRTPLSMHLGVPAKTAATIPCPRDMRSQSAPRLCSAMWLVHMIGVSLVLLWRMGSHIMRQAVASVATICCAVG
jgi:hypothetical protein